MKGTVAFGGKTYHKVGALVAILASILWLRQPSVGNVDPDAERSVTEIIADKGYPVQEYAVTTRDGYVLPLQRIPYGRHELRSSSSSPHRFHPGPPVILMHALLFSSYVWVVNGPDQSLPYILADAGFDVWLGNVRGNSQSRHVNYTFYQKELWDFSFEEMSEFDLPDTIDFVLNVTSHNKTFIIGHSMGAATTFVLLTEKPEYNDKILLFSAMAPAVRIHNMTSQIRHILPFIGDLAPVAALFGRYDFLYHDRLIDFTVKTLCRYPVCRAFCPWFISFASGQQTQPINATRLPVFLKDVPSGTSYKNMIHMTQVSMEDPKA
ncbi:lipase member K-like [Rhipicephalus sanguineus]|uniref:lipase member K-like n=1 Tax=Rhipicephalus sanguineus TaxID=34632 RepID=UPI0020C559C0|nr:lipase member K-like [Rhipicephalus sanguineus]